MFASRGVMLRRETLTGSFVILILGSEFMQSVF